MKQFSTSLYFHICLILMIHNDARLTGLLLFYVSATTIFWQPTCFLGIMITTHKSDFSKLN